MTRRSRIALWVPVGLGVAAAVACSDAFLFDDRRTDQVPVDRAITVKGEFCTPSANDVVRPIKILIAMDASQSMGVTDPNGTRANATVQLLDSLPQDPEIYVAVMLFAGSTTVFLGLPPDSGTAGSQFKSITSMDPLERQLIRQQILNFNSSAPNRDSTDFVKAMADIYATLSDDIAITRADPAKAAYAARSRYSVIFLSDGHPTICQDDLLVLGDSNACTRLRQLTDLAEDVRLNTVHVFNPTQPLSTVCDLTQPPGTCGAPTGCPSLIINQDAERLATMAALGGGDFRDFRNGEPINYLNFKFGQVRRAYQVKELVVANLSAPPGSPDNAADSDSDGLTDAQEAQLRTNPRLKDTDGDGFSDGVEVFFAGRGATFNPTVLVLPDGGGGDPGCPPSLRRVDTDCDGLYDCDEHILSGNADLIDTDSDGIPDAIEWQHHTSNATNDLQEDPDNDFLVNRQELKLHMNPLGPDVGSLSTGGYRYFIEAKGPPDETGKQCFSFRVENVLLEPTLDSWGDAGALGGLTDAGTLIDGGVWDAGHGAGYNDILVSLAVVPLDDPNAKTLIRQTRFQEARYPIGGVKSPPDGILYVNQDRLTDYCPRPALLDGGTDGGP
ncbi:MAG TPA: VWA domain-containing protein [Myxococcaceae bacterium]